MNHRPFEEWLLDNESLTQEQKLELDDHLKLCPHCSALVSVDKVLRSPVIASPSPGFSDRFKLKLNAERVLRRRRLFWGFNLLGFLTVILIVFISYQLVGNWTVSPSELFVNMVTWFTDIAITARTFGSVGLALINFVLGIIPLPFWFSFIAGGFLLVLVWILSLWKLSYSTQVRRLT